jgi:hypothetical protein
MFHITGVLGIAISIYIFFFPQIPSINEADVNFLKNYVTSTPSVKFIWALPLFGKTSICSIWDFFFSSFGWG